MSLKNMNKTSKGHQSLLDPNESPLWAITTYFNPLGYKSRLRNYHLFRQCLAVPLVTVEWSSSQCFELDSDDADILIQISSPDILWQKERLLNVALNALPSECDKVAWIDCDVVFENDDWPRDACKALDRHLVIQPFERSYELRGDANANQIDSSHAHLMCDSLARGLAKGKVKPDILLSTDKRVLGCMPGLAWAARREILQKNYLYDACILGTGDGAIMAGVLGNFQDLIDYLMMNPRRAEHFLDWARPVFETVRGDLGYSRGTVYHLWHGDLKDRHYLERRVGFAQFDFDPHSDIAIDENGCWRWSSYKPDMHRFVRDYFVSRMEDGRHQ